MEPSDGSGDNVPGRSPQQRGVRALQLQLGVHRLHLLHQGLGHPGLRQVHPNAVVSDESLWETLVMSSRKSAGFFSRCPDVWQVVRSSKHGRRLRVQHQPDRHHPRRREPHQPDRTQPQWVRSIRRCWELSPSLGPTKVSRGRGLNP